MNWTAEAVAAWDGHHTDLHHPGSRNDCDHCQEMIALFGPMPPVELLAKRHRENIRQWRATQYQKVTISKAIRAQVFDRDTYQCRHCGATEHLRVDHIYPERHGGTLDMDNLQTLCRSCNSRKGARLPEVE